MPILRDAGWALHRQFARNPRLAALYLDLWRLPLACLPESGLKRHLRNNLVTAAWPALDLGLRDVRLADGQKARLRIRTPSVTFAKGMYRRQVGHEPGVFAFLAGRMRRYDAVVEIGANVGVYTVFFSRSLDGRGPVLAYEPSRFAFGDLAEHLRVNGCANVVARQAAVAPRSGAVTFHENPWDWMKGSLNRDDAQLFHRGAEVTTTVPAVTGAEILQQLGARERVLVKIDVVGSEAEALEGLRPLLEAKRPDIVLGVWSRNCAALNALAWLGELGYARSRIGEGGLEPRAAFADSEYCNYFLAPATRDTSSRS